ncbi:hypothetical protein [Streptomyces graminofaciens]|uniref:hypothetical protein n=1 Tax=Streptomyces graminofaciens TaxID=68212 RepID=UPI0025748585|nr:hypothetical protein [Streptomyces graminofaciens]
MSSTARRLDGSTARRLDGSTARRLGGSAARRLGGSTERLADHRGVVELAALQGAVEGARACPIGGE